eukprot:GHRQ01006857.1.p3 GENE.GHRQ01006857.1~~GHRQ01006857.1.p3  ORF type:complete len:102 (-),score=22.11 GHRQ01006857.1:97-402(-)
MLLMPNSPTSVAAAVAAATSSSATAATRNTPAPAMQSHVPAQHPYVVRMGGSTMLLVPRILPCRSGNSSQSPSVVTLPSMSTQLGYTSRCPWGSATQSGPA